MNSKKIYALVAASLIAAPIAALAQSTDNNAPATRSEVKGQLQQLEQNGYDPAQRDPHYPHNIQAAESRVDSQNGDNGMVQYNTAQNGANPGSMPVARDQYGNRMNAQQYNGNANGGNAYNSYGASMNGSYRSGGPATPGTPGSPSIYQGN